MKLSIVLFVALVAAPAVFACPAGQYNFLFNCLNCNAGYYSAAGATSCTICPTGHYSGVASASCTACPKGYYEASTGASACTACPAGTYNENTGSTSSAACLPTPAGYAYPNPGCSDFIFGGCGQYACPAGSWAGAAASSCTGCPAGTYSTTVAAASESTCTCCPVQTYSMSTGQSSCAACTAVCNAYYCVESPLNCLSDPSKCCACECVGGCPP